MNSKQKGGSYERLISKKLSLWVSDGKNEDIFWRSSLSGGRATIAFRSGKTLRRQAGDISAVAPEGHALTSPFFIECKHVRNLALESFMLKGKGLLTSFWVTALEEAKKHDKSPLIIARQNNTPDLVLSEPGALGKICPIRSSKGMCTVVKSADGWVCEVRLLKDVLELMFHTQEQ